MASLAWICVSVPDGKDVTEVLQKAQDGMGQDGQIIAMKPVKSVINAQE